MLTQCPSGYRYYLTLIYFSRSFQVRYHHTLGIRYPKISWYDVYQSKSEGDLLWYALCWDFKLESSLLRSSVRLYVQSYLTGVVDCGCKVHLFGDPSFPQKRGPSTGQMTHPLLWLPTYRRRRVKDWHRTSKALQNLVFVHMHVVPVYIMYVISKQDVIVLKIQGSQGRTNSVPSNK